MSQCKCDTTLKQKGMQYASGEQNRNISLLKLNGAVLSRKYALNRQLLVSFIINLTLGALIYAIALASDL